MHTHTHKHKQRRDGKNGNRNRNGDGNEDEVGNEDRDRNENGNMKRDDNGKECGGEKEPENLPRDTNCRCGAEDARKGAMPTGNGQPQPQDPTPQRDRIIKRGTTVQGREVRNGAEVSEEGPKQNKKPLKSYTRDVGNGGDL